ncbi:peptidoglycan-binding protein [Candidatus Campbellbacteria bacterium]|nr:MAG: peptidoglycan-binding protein [Candidatus Campbellbacteria bacterium]
MIKRISLVGLLAAALFVGSTAQAATAEELQAQITALLAQISQLQGGSSAASTGCYAFTRDLTLGSSGADVTALQSYLASKGMFSATATGFFGPLTKTAVSAWQTANGVMPAAGYFGAVSRAKFASTCAPTTTTGGTTTGGSTSLQGGAGSVNDYSLTTALNNEKVGENEEDVSVLGLEVEADDGSDLALTAVRLNFDKGSATNNFDKYASDVSVWLDGEEYGRVDASEFTKSNNYQKTISLDNGAVIKAGEIGKLVVKVSGISSLKATGTWTLDINQVRFEDAQGSLISEDPSTAARTLQFESFASASNIELKASLGDATINDAHVINVDATDDTADVELLSFNLEAKGTSDILINEIPVLFTATGAGNVDDMISDVTLYADGEEIGSENVPTTSGATETITFTDLNYTLPAGDKVVFVVKANFLSLADALDAGDTIKAEMSGTEVDLIDAEDEAGEALTSGDLTGTALGEASVVYDSGIAVKLVGNPTAVRTFTADAAGEDDQGEYKIVFDVTAFDDDMYIDASTLDYVGAADAAGQGVVFATSTSAGQPVVSSKVLSAQGTETKDSAGSFWIEDGQTRRFTLTVILTADTTPTDGSSVVSIRSINWADATTAEAAGGVVDGDFVNYYTFNLDEFKTDPLFLNAM